MPGGISQVPRTPFDVMERERVLGFRGEQVLAFVRSFFSIHGEAPSYDRICDELGISSRGKVSEIVAGLERRKLLLRTGPICGQGNRRIRLP